MKLSDALAALTYEADELDDDEVLSDVVVVGRVTRLGDGRNTVTLARTAGSDVVTLLGLLAAARQITDSGDWDQVDDG